MRIAIVTPLLVDLRRRRQPPRRGARRGVDRPRPRGARAGALGSRLIALSRALHRGARRSAGSAPDYLIPLGRTVGIGANGAVSNLSAFPDAVTAMRRELRAGRLRRRPRARAGRADARLGRVLASAARRSSAPSTPTRPSGCRNAIAEPARRAAQVQPAQRADRRLARPRAWTGRALVRRRLRRRSPTASTSTPRPRGPKPRVGRAAAAVRRPRRGAQGPAGPAAGVRGAGRARARPADGDRRRPPRTSQRYLADPAVERTHRGARRGRRARSCGAACTRPTCSAPRRSPARASAWS